MSDIPTGIGTTDATAVMPLLPPRPLSIAEARERLRRSDRVLVHCDGGCEPNPGVGGFGVVIDCHRVGRVEIIGGEPVTTNNRMELMAAITALSVLQRGCQAVIVCDSQYVVNGSTIWAPKRTRRLKQGKAVLNADLWRRLDDEAATRRVTWRWVRGHNGHPDNERADQLATDGMLMIRRVAP